MQSCFPALRNSAIVALTLVVSSGMCGQTKTLTRDLEPVLLQGSSFSGFAGAPLGELFLYAYDSAEAAWQQIPFQIDEIGISGNKSGYFIPDDGLLDDNDELAFMARDAGDLAPDSWIPDSGSQAFDRYEIEVSNPLELSEKGWVYLYRSASLTVDDNLVDYIDWHASATGNAGQDTVRSIFYEMSHGTGGFPEDLRITQAGGGNDQDLLDRLKLRATIAIGIIEFPPIDETAIVVSSEGDDGVRAVDGRVRVVREVNATLEGLDLNFESGALFYYPYSISYTIEIPSLEGLGGSAVLLSGRLSLDLNQNAANMTFISANNPNGFTVDGSPDTPNTEIDSQLPGNNWASVRGEQGTIVHLFPIESSVGGSRSLYYKDDNSVDDEDTGDEMSYADIGLAVADTIQPPAIFSYKGYYLGADAPADIGAQIANFERNPLDAGEPLRQSFGDVTTAVEIRVGAGVPETFALFQNYPNPFNPATEIRYQIPVTKSGEGKKTTLAIYNLLGEKVRTLVSTRRMPGVYAVSWDGRNDFGTPVTSGLYVYRLSSGDFVESKKMLFVQ